MRDSPISPEAMSRLWDSPGSYWVTPNTRGADLSAGCYAPVTRRLYSGPREGQLLWSLRRWPVVRKELPVREPAYGTNGALVGWSEDRSSPPPVFFIPVRYWEADYPCRRCEHCLRLRAALWRRRMQMEIAMSSRTWFVTYTIRPHDRVLIDCRRRGRQDPAHYSLEDVFLDRHRVIQRDFTLYFKRVRKAIAGHSLRYILVAEAHQDGWPHYHALVHERGWPVTKRVLEEQWPLGFTVCRLVDKDRRGMAGYLAKYLSKQALARVRASLRYGDGLSPELACRLSEGLACGGESNVIYTLNSGGQGATGAPPR